MRQSTFIGGSMDGKVRPTPGAREHCVPIVRSQVSEATCSAMSMSGFTRPTGRFDVEVYVRRPCIHSDGTFVYDFERILHQ